MNNKQRATAAVIVLFGVFLALLIWYMATHPAPEAAIPGNIATSTTPAAETLHIKDEGEFYEIDAAYPASTPLKASAGVEADARAVAAMKAFEENAIVAFKENAGIGEGGPEELARIKEYNLKYAMNIEYKFYSGPKTISYVYSIYQDTLGAHPNMYYRTFTFDRDTGEALGLDELFSPGTPYLERLSTRTRADLPKIMGKMAELPPEQVDMDYINSGTLPIADAFQNFAVDNETLLMIFPPYQVGPYVYGTITDPIPLADLKDILNPEYR
jgi:hypothetical protein